MAKQFKKGDVVWSIQNWNSRATVYVRKLTIQSWGKQRGTASSVQDGQMIKHQIYVGQDDHLFLASDVEDINSFALDVAAKQKLKEIDWCRNAVHHHYVGAGNNAFDSYFKKVNSDCQAIMDEEPTVLFED
jgi:hypothetical protein